jgi:hypothetical protein
MSTSSNPAGVGSPLHLHHANEELLLVLSGTPTLRSPEGDAAPVGWRGDRVPSCLHDQPPDVVEYPDTGATLVVLAEQRLAYPHGADKHQTRVITEAMRAGADRDA